MQFAPYLRQRSLCSKSAISILIGAIVFLLVLGSSYQSVRYANSSSIIHEFKMDMSILCKGWIEV